MAAAFLLLAALLFRSGLWADDSKDQAPSFSSDSIVNSANGSSGSLTPNTLATVYGERLAFSTAEASLNGVGALPLSLASVHILVGSIPAPLLYVSPTQINFLIPADLLPGKVNVIVTRQATSSQAQIALVDAAPALFLVEHATKLAAIHADGKLITADSPAQPGEIIVIFGAGLGRTDPRQIDGVIPRAAAPILLLDRLTILLDDQRLPPGSIYYAGITPGFSGLYQINLRLPGEFTRKEPELRVVMGEESSQRAIVLQVAPGMAVNH